MDRSSGHAIKGRMGDFQMAVLRRFLENVVNSVLVTLRMGEVFAFLL